MGREDRPKQGGQGNAPTSHDQNFKNLIVDYPRQALAFFASEEAADLDESVRIVPVRQEQLKDRLGERFRELDIPLLVEWPDGRRAVLLFVVEQETDPRRFSVYRLVRYCVDLAKLMKTDRVVPVVIFLHRGSYPEELTLASDRHTYLRFQFLHCQLSRLEAADYLESDNLAARLNLPNMRHTRAQRLRVYGQAVRGLLTLEPDPERRAKYLDFIDIYAALDDNERQRYEREYPLEAEQMSHFAERFRKEGRQEGEHAGEVNALIRLLDRKFGPVPAETRRRIQEADLATLDTWLDRVLTAESLQEVLH